jgi:UDP-2,4-diacetamido-2,4,6-trideoxy-beta-L-altropyranose hydrolase
MRPARVLFRADGNKKIGLGHIHRCLALGEIIRSDFGLAFAIRDPLPGLATIVCEAGGDLICLPDNTDYYQEAHGLLSVLQGYDIIVLDGYFFDTEYQQIIRSVNIKVVCIDDIHSFHFVSDGIINHAGGVKKELYSTAPLTQLFLGTRYCIIKKEFLQAARDNVEAAERESAILICMGGADPDNHTLSVLKKCIVHAGSNRFYIIIGEAYQHLHDLKQFVDQCACNVSVLKDLKADQMTHYMKKCPVAICPPSGVAYEYLCVGGELYLQQTADNQHHINAYLLDNSLAFRFSDFRILDAVRIQKSLEQQKKEFDGSSQQTLLRVFRSFYREQITIVRKAAETDLMLVFQWANDLETRRNAFTSEPISLEKHTGWFKEKLVDDNVYLYIFEYQDKPIGQIRFDVSQDAMITYAVAPEYRSIGFGTIIVKKGIQQFLAESSFRGAITGYVKHRNESSNAIFLKLGFSQESDTNRTNSFKYRLNLTGNGNKN